MQYYTTEKLSFKQLNNPHGEGVWFVQLPMSVYDRSGLDGASHIDLQSAILPDSSAFEPRDRFYYLYHPQLAETARAARQQAWFHLTLPGRKRALSKVLEILYRQDANIINCQSIDHGEILGGRFIFTCEADNIEKLTELLEDYAPLVTVGERSGGTYQEGPRTQDRLAPLEPDFLPSVTEAGYRWLPNPPRLLKSEVIYSEVDLAAKAVSLEPFDRDRDYWLLLMTREGSEKLFFRELYNYLEREGESDRENLLSITVDNRSGGIKVTSMHPSEHFAFIDLLRPNKPGELRSVVKPLGQMNVNLRLVRPESIKTNGERKRGEFQFRVEGNVRDSKLRLFGKKSCAEILRARMLLSVFETAVEAGNSSEKPSSSELEPGSDGTTSEADAPGDGEEGGLAVWSARVARSQRLELSQANLDRVLEEAQRDNNRRFGVKLMTPDRSEQWRIASEIEEYRKGDLKNGVAVGTNQKFTLVFDLPSSSKSLVLQIQLAVPNISDASLELMANGAFREVEDLGRSIGTSGLSDAAELYRAKAIDSLSDQLFGVWLTAQLLGLTKQAQAFAEATRGRRLESWDSFAEDARLSVVGPILGGFAGGVFWPVPQFRIEVREKAGEGTLIVGRIEPVDASDSRREKIVESTSKVIEAVPDLKTTEDPELVKEALRKLRALLEVQPGGDKKKNASRSAARGERRTSGS